MVLVNQAFRKRKNFFEKYPQFAARWLKNFRQPCPRHKKKAEYRF
jgi:hypothetical protein